MFIGVRPQIFGVTAFVIAIAISVALVSGIWFKLALGAATAVLAVTVPLVWLHRRARSQSAAHCAAIRQWVADGEKYKQQCLIDAKAYYEAQREKMAKRHRRDVRQAHERHLARMTEIISDRDGAITEADDDFQHRAAQFVARRDSALQAAQGKYPALLSEIQARNEREQAEISSPLRSANGREPCSARGGVERTGESLSRREWSKFSQRSPS